jgi:hypothetical protein
MDNTLTKRLPLTYYPRSLEAGMKLIRKLRAKYGAAAKCHLKVRGGEVILNVTLED